MTNGTGSGGAEKLSHLRAVTKSGLDQNKVTAALPESATKSPAHGAIFAKGVIKAEGFDGGNEDHDMNGSTQTEFDTERKDTHEEEEEGL
jgi:hypothetical protein